MASLRQLQNKVKTFKDFQKVVNIQKIVVMKEIMELKRFVEQASFRRRLFTNQLLDMNKKYRILDPSVFDAKKSNIPVQRDIHFILPNPSDDKLGEYANKLVIEHVKKNHKRNDLYVVVGGVDLDKALKEIGANVIKVMNNVDFDSQDTYARIAFQILRGHSDMLFNKADFIYLNVLEKKVLEETLFPFNTEKHDFTAEEKSRFTEDMKLILDTNISKVTFYKDVDAVAKHMLKQSINMQVYSTMINYRIAMCTRELQSLDDKEKNIKAEIELVRLRMQRVRKDNITNELLVNAVAFGTLNAKEDDDE